MADICGDNRFELIEKYKQKLLDATNIGDSPEEMAVIDNILFRFWQMGWLKGELFGNSEQLNCADCVNHGGDWECDHVQCRKGADTISRKAALDVLHGYFDRMLDTDTVCPKDLYNEFEALPSAQQWIPCSERLPEEEKAYLVTFANEKVGMSSWHKDTLYNRGFDAYLTGLTEDGEFEYFGVVAWMEKPEPWKGEPHD